MAGKSKATADARAVMELAQELPEHERRQVERFGQPTVAGSAAGQGVGAVTGGSSWALLVWLGFPQWASAKTGLDFMDPIAVGYIGAAMTAVSAWFGRVLNEFRKDHPEIVRKLGGRSLKARSAILACLLLLGCGKGLSIGQVTLVPAAETPAKQWAVWSGVFGGARAAFAVCVRDVQCRDRLSADTLRATLKATQLAQVAIERTQTLLDDPGAAEFVDAAIVIVRESTLEVMASLSPETRRNLTAFLFEIDSGRAAFEEAFPDG